MDIVNEAIEALKHVALKGKKKGIAEQVDSLTTTLRLLDTSLSADSQIFGKLVAAVREPFIPLYQEFPFQTFQLSAAIFSFLFHNKIVMQLTAGNRVLQSSWERVAESLLSGILDFLETRSDSTTLRTLASVLYPILCRICFSTAFCSSITMGSTLRYNAFMLLVDSADEPTNKDMLRDPEYLGSRRLGATLYGSKDYIILENLLLLVLIVAPEFKSMDKRISFMREVFVTNYPNDTTCGESIARILAKPRERDSDLLQAQAIELLAKSNLMFPQPFDVSHIDSCGLRFPQRPPQQRLIVDYKSFMANVIKDEGYESFRVPFDQICGISFSAEGKASFVRVAVRTSFAPTIQSRPLKVPDGQASSVAFEIKESDILRFKRALRSRGIAGPPHISVSEEGPRLEFDQEGSTIPDILAPMHKVQIIEREMQLSQRDGGSSKDESDKDCEDLLINKPLLIPSTHSTGGTHQEETAAAPSRPVLVTSRVLHDRQDPLKTQKDTKNATILLAAKIPDVTPPSKAPRHPSVFVPATPSQNRHEDVFGSGDTDLSEPSDGSDVDSMKALSQKLAARTDSLNAITKHASVLVNTVSSAGASGKKTRKRRVLDSDDEQALSSSRKDAKSGSKSGASNAKNVVSSTVVPDEDYLPPPPAPLNKERPKPIKKNPGSLEDMKPSARGSRTQKRKREGDDDDAEAGAIVDVQENPPPTKRARKTAGGKTVAAGPQVVSPAPLRDFQVLKKSRPAAKKNANYGRRAKAARISSPAHDSALFSGDGAGTLDLETRSVEPCVVSHLMGSTGGQVSLPALKLKPKLKPKVASKPKPRLAEKTVPPGNPKTKAVRAKAKTQIGTRTRAAAAKAKGAGEENIKKEDPPKKEKAKGKVKMVSMDKEGDEEEGETTKVELTKDSLAFIEVSSSPPESSKPECKPVSRVTPQEERVEHAPKTDDRTTTRPAPKKKVLLSQGEGDTRGEEEIMEPVEVVVVPTHSPKGSTLTETRTKIPTKPISEQAFSISVEHRQDDRTSESTKAERLPVAEPCTAHSLRLVEADPAVAARGAVDYEVEAEMEVEREAVVASGQGSHEMDLVSDRFDPIVTQSPVKVQTVGITKMSPVRVREFVEPDETRLLEINPDDGESPEDGIRDFMLPQPIMDRISVDIPPPKESLWIRTGMGMIAQSTPTTLPHGPPQLGLAANKKPKVTFADTPFKEKEVVRSGQNEITPGSGPRRRTIFEDGMFGTKGAWKRAPEKGPEKHSALVGVLNEIQDVIVKQITNQFEVAEEEARFARNDVHQEALADFKKMHSQRAVQFNALVDLEAAYATREKKLVAAYENVLAMNAEILGHVRQRIREHDERNVVGKLPKTFRRNPSALMSSYLK